MSFDIAVSSHLMVDILFTIILVMTIDWINISVTNCKRNIGSAHKT